MNSVGREGPRAHLHQAMPMPQQLPQISILRTGYTNLRKANLPHVGILTEGPDGVQLGHAGPLPILSTRVTNVIFESSRSQI
jgi:hypothetical protein